MALPLLVAEYGGTGGHSSMIGTEIQSVQSAVNATRGLDRVAYLDPSLRCNLGHFANSCRHIAGELRDRSRSVDVYGHRLMTPELAIELKAAPFIHHAPVDPVVAYPPLSRLRALDYFLARDSFFHDLQAMWRRGPYDLVYINSAMAAQVGAVALWMDSFVSGSEPHVAVELGCPSGNGVQVGHMSGWWEQFPPLYRKAGEILARRTRQNLLFFTFDEAGSEDYSQLLGVPVRTMPTVHGGARQPRLRVRDSRGMVTVAFLGHQRDEKGYRLVPAVIRRLRAEGAPVRILVHNGGRDEAAVDAELQRIADADPEVTLDQTTADAIYWQELLDRSDLIVLPYEPTRYRASYSAVAVEAAGQGIPMVVPGDTTMAQLVRKYHTRGELFSEWNDRAVADAIIRAVQDFEGKAHAAADGAAEWIRSNGAARFVDRLLDSLPASAGMSIFGSRDRASLKSFLFHSLFAGKSACIQGIRKLQRISQPR